MADLNLPSARAVYQHPQSGATLIPLLRQYLPYSIPLFRRLQSDIRTDGTTVLATFPASPANPDHDTSASTQAEPPGDDLRGCFCAALVDRQARPSTEMFVFMSGEVRGGCTTRLSRTALNEDDTPTSCHACTSALLSVLHYITTLDLSTPTVPAATILPNRYHAHAHHTSILLLGGAAPLVCTTLARHGCLWSVYSGSDRGDANVKFMFALDGSGMRAALTRGLPEGLRWGALSEADLRRVQSRTAIPRPAGALARAPSLGVFVEGDGARWQGKRREGDGDMDDTGTGMSDEDAVAEAVAWAFLGVDASLSSLHVEPEFRGRGVAKALAAKLFSEQTAQFGTERLAHADVHFENAESAAVCRAIGGDVGWESFWLRVDLDETKKLRFGEGLQ